MNTTGTVWLGTTLACAQCHNHKFDPVSQKDYYRMLAFFDNGEYAVHGQGEEVVDRWIVEPELELPTPEQAKRREALRREAETLRLEIDGPRPRGRARRVRAARSRAPRRRSRRSRRCASRRRAGPRFRKLADGSLLVSGEVKDKDTYTVTVRAALRAASRPSASRRSPTRRCPARARAAPARAPSW